MGVIRVIWVMLLFMPSVLTAGTLYRGAGFSLGVPDGMHFEEAKDLALCDDLYCGVSENGSVVSLTYRRYFEVSGKEQMTDHIHQSAALMRMIDGIKVTDVRLLSEGVPPIGLILTERQDNALREAGNFSESTIYQANFSVGVEGGIYMIYFYAPERSEALAELEIFTENIATLVRAEERMSMPALRTALYVGGAIALTVILFVIFRDRRRRRERMRAETSEA